MLHHLRHAAFALVAIAPAVADPAPPVAVPAAPDATPKPYYEMLNQMPPSTGVAAFMVGDSGFNVWRLSDWHPDLTQHVLVVFLDGATSAPKYAAYAIVDYKLECYPHARKVTAFTTYASDGKVLKKATKLPPRGATWFNENELNGDRGNQCRRVVPGREQPPAPPSMQEPPRKERPNIFYLGSAVADTVPAAIAIARDNAARIVAARKMPQTGNFAVGEAEPDWGVVVLDTATLKRDDTGGASVSWMLVRKPDHNPASYLRITHKLDCTARKATPETIAAFGADGKLVKFDFGGRAEKFKFMDDINQVFDKVCDGMPVETGPTLATIAEALAAARAKLAP